MQHKQKSEKKLEIGGRIRTIRTDLKLSMDDLAAKIGSTSGTVSNIENGFSLPSAETLLRLTEALHITADWILHGRQPRMATEHIQESGTRDIFFNEKWHFFCHYRETYATAAELALLDKYSELLRTAGQMSPESIDLLLNVARKFKQSEN